MEGDIRPHTHTHTPFSLSRVWDKGHRYLLAAARRSSSQPLCGSGGETLERRLWCLLLQELIRSTRNHLRAAGDTLGEAAGRCSRVFERE